MASRTKLLTDLTLADLWKEVKDPATLWGDLSAEAHRALKLILQNRMHEELAQYLRAPHYGRVRGRRGFRSGHYRRAFTTTWGTIPDLEIPRSRDGGFRTSVAYGITHRGLHAALELVYPTTPRQACWVHVLRNVTRRLRLRDRERCLALARQIYQARSRSAAETALHQWARAWKPTAPTAGACLLRDWEALLAFYVASHHDWRRVRTTNAIERAFREVRRRTRPMSCFTNTASCDRITYAIMHYLNNSQWQGRPIRRESTPHS